MWYPDGGAKAESIRRDLTALGAEQNTGCDMPGAPDLIAFPDQQRREREKEENRVSAVLVTYNRARFLPRTLESVLSQSWQDFELQICDDCSTDETSAVCEQFQKAHPERIRYFRNERNLSMPGNVNRGIQRASHNLVAILHDGDIYHETILEKWRQALVDHPEAAFVFNGYRHLDENGGGVDIRFDLPEVVSGQKFLDFCFADKRVECPVWGTVMLRRNWLAEIGYFNAHYSFWADVDAWFRLAYEHDVAYVDESLMDLPCKKVMPHLFSEGALAAHRHVFTAYLHARWRHYRGHRKLKAIAQHVGWFTTERSKRLLARAMAQGKRG